MAATPPLENRLRAGRDDLNLLGRALVISLALHVLGYGGYQAAHRFGWLEHIQLPAWLTKVKEKLVVTIPAQIHPPINNEPPQVFVEVNPVQVVTAPKNAKYYSDQNSRAANPDANADSNTPKISGTQTHIVKTEDVPRPQTTHAATPPAQPTPRAEPQPQTEAAKKSETPGELAMAKPDTKLRPETLQPDVEQPRPRTIAEAQARQAMTIVGEAMKQDGGTRQIALTSSLDAIGTSFGAYNKALIAAISSRWFALLEHQPLTRASGKVVVEFYLHDDGRVTDVSVVENTVGELLGALCQRAIIDPQPYAPWTSDMRRLAQSNFKDILFTFYY